MEEKTIKNVDELNDYQSYYSEEKLLDKFASALGSAGKKVIKMALLLFNVLKSKNVSVKDKGIIIGALGYFILPIDLIPDIIPILGFTDDLAALSLAYKSVKNNITPEIEDKTERRLKEMFDKKKQ